MLVLALVALPLRCLGFSAAAPRSFPGASFGTNPELGALKLQIAQLSASLDRGQLRYKQFHRSHHQWKGCGPR